MKSIEKFSEVTCSGKITQKTMTEGQHQAVLQRAGPNGRGDTASDQVGSDRSRN
jgi:hypothetical protein